MARRVTSRVNGTWSQQQRLTATDGTANDSFGNDAAVSGDLAVIGAPLKSIVANSQQGVAYVFTRGGTTWSQLQEFTASDNAAGDNFGSVVALDFNTILVGASGKKIGSNFSQGSAYVFTRSDSTWNQQLRLTAGDGVGGDFFGKSAALSGGTTLVGASY